MKRTRWSKEEDEAIKLMIESNPEATPYQIGQWLAGDTIERNPEAIARRGEYLKINRQKQIIAERIEEVERNNEEPAEAEPAEKPSYMKLAEAVKRITDEYEFCVKDALLIIQASGRLKKNG